MYIIYIYIYICVCVIMKAMSPPVCHYNSFVATYALGHMMYSLMNFASCAQVHK